MINTTSTSETNIAVFNGGAIRIDDILRETITQYDVLHAFLPFVNYVLTVCLFRF
jgi:2',3'-cyclic-nucleotide 2'-phosphodiesterase (5'-nucleotidase family)